jgi:hypothetical protein
MKLNSPSSEMKEHNRGDVVYDRLVLTGNLVVTMNDECYVERMGRRWEPPRRTSFDSR